MLCISIVIFAAACTGRETAPDDPPAEDQAEQVPAESGDDPDTMPVVAMAARRIAINVASGDGDAGRSGG